MTDVRFREFGNGATWVDLAMTQEASDILHELKVREPCMIDMDGVRPAKANRPQYIILDIKERDEIVAALTAATDFVCPKCGSRGYIKDGATTITAAAEAGRTGQEASDNATSSLDFSAAAEAGEQRACATCGAILADGPQPACTYVAAAETREPLQDEPCPELAREMREAHKRKVNRTAAAEAGEKETGLDYMLRHSVANNNATIERCAQVAIEIANDMSIRAQDKPMKIIAAIRAMKEEGP